MPILSLSVSFGLCDILWLLTALSNSSAIDAISPTCLSLFLIGSPDTWYREMHLIPEISVWYKTVQLEPKRCETLIQLGLFIAIGMFNTMKFLHLGSENHSCSNGVGSHYTTADYYGIVGYFHSAAKDYFINNYEERLMDKSLYSPEGLGRTLFPSLSLSAPTAYTIRQ